MEYLAKDMIALLYFLLPGFLAAWVFFGLTAHPKREPFDRVVQALIFTVIIKAIGVGVRKLWWLRWHSSHPLAVWDDEIDIVVSVLIAVGVGLIFATSANWDFPHRLLRKMGLTKRTSYPSEWYSGFHRIRRDVILHLTGERRLLGWAEEWPDQCDKGHFLILDARWLTDSGTPIPLSQVKRVMVSSADVEMVEFLCNEDEINHLKREDIIASQKPLADLHTRKDTSDERRAEAVTTAKPVHEPTTKDSDGKPSDDSSGAHHGGGRDQGGSNGPQQSTAENSANVPPPPAPPPKKK